MIEKIQVKEVASYDTVGINVDLDKINYIYGSNGTGKTTISEMLRSGDSQTFSSCNIEWRQGSPELDLFVYNKHFVSENFSEHNEVKGIFTLGMESTEILALIDEKKIGAEKHQEQIGKLEGYLNEKEEKLETLKIDFTDQCWDLKIKYDEIFKEAFTGVRNSRENFMIRCLHEAENNSSELKTFEELSQRVESVFKAPQDKVSGIPAIQYDSTLEEHSIFQTKIIGKEDIDIARLISELDISDWVQQGHKKLESTNDLCPFCQQSLPVGFKENLEEYFDGTYTEQIQILESTIKEYETVTNALFEKCSHLITEDLPFINKEKMASLFDVMNSTYKGNIQLLVRKRKEPSRSIQLSTIKVYLEQMNTEIEQANLQIVELNRVIDNIKEEKEILIKEIWRFITEENKDTYERYMSNLGRKSRTIRGMRQSKARLAGYKRSLDNEVIELQKDLTSVLPSIDAINSLLKSFGFTNFQLAESNEEGNYKIVRENGEDANETLSEGEKTFITFLYFYQLINGSDEQDKVNTARIIVIDDPISSLDSNILFMVSNLINNLKKKVRSNDENFKQLIILTHNVYFHKEISFNKGKGSQRLNDETFWIVRKKDNISYITEYEKNPIKNSYELLWQELKENSNSITTPNIMRRILENYFKFFGNIDVEVAIEEFPEEDRIVCNTLLSWVNDGSHHVNDDLYVDSNPELNIKYFDVFRRIFINSNHESHFNMMMGDFESVVEENAASNVAEREIREVMTQVAASRE